MARALARLTGSDRRPRLHPLGVVLSLALVAGFGTACDLGGTNAADGQPSATASATKAAERAAKKAERQQQNSTSTSASLVRMVSGLPLPDRELTPGDAFDGVGTSTICVSGYPSTVRHVTESTRRQVFAAYHISYAEHSAYELDHLIPLELGGSNAISNLWPEKGPIPNSKDGLENQLHNMVCQGEMELASAQNKIAKNWVAALKKYGGSGHVYTRSPASSSHSQSAPKPRPSYPTMRNTDQGTVHPGAWCAPRTATGHTKDGTPMVCAPASDGTNRWKHR